MKHFTDLKMAMLAVLIGIAGAVCGNEKIASDFAAPMADKAPHRMLTG